MTSSWQVTDWLYRRHVDKIHFPYTDSGFSTYLWVLCRMLTMRERPRNMGAQLPAWETIYVLQDLNINRTTQKCKRRMNCLKPCPRLVLLQFCHTLFCRRCMQKCYTYTIEVPGVSIHIIYQSPTGGYYHGEKSTAECRYNAVTYCKILHKW